MDDDSNNPRPIPDLSDRTPTKRTASPTKGILRAGTLFPPIALMDRRHLKIKPADQLVEGRKMLGDAIYVASDFPVAYQASQNSQQRSEQVIATYQERVTERAEPRPFNPDEIDRGFVQHGMCF